MNNIDNKRKPEKSVSLWGSKPNALNQQSIFFIRPTGSHHEFKTSKVT